MSPSVKRWLINGVIAVFVVGLSLFVFFAVDDDLGEPVSNDGPAPVSPRDQLVEIGGVKRPSTDIADPGVLGKSRPASDIPTVDYGTTPLVPADANPQVESVAEALRTGKFPERVSSQTLPKPFDAAAYAEDPEAYLNVVEPGRIWQPAQPGPDVPRLSPINAQFAEIEQGESVPFRVKAVPGAPVTFTSFDLGEFQNRLTSTTVQADDEGVATARFTGTPGTVHYVTILAASPMTSGQLQYIVNVLPPRNAGSDAVTATDAKAQ